MYKSETLIVLLDYQELLNTYTTKESRIRWGVLCTPILLGGKFCLPLGWENELKADNVSYIIETVHWFENTEI